MIDREKLPRKELDDLLDYIYENGTSSEGIDSLAMKLCNAVRNAALAEVMSLCAKEWHAQIELDTARNAKNALMCSPDSAKWQKMMTLIRGIK